jgi:hypothetical protein
MLSPTAEVYRVADSFAEMRLTWDSQGLDMVEAVVADGVFAKCSVNNSQWRKNNGVGSTDFQFSTCAKSCEWVAGFGRKCVILTLALASVYDVLISTRDASAAVRAVRVRAPWVHTAGGCRVSEGTSTICGGSDITWHGGLLSIGGTARMGAMGTQITRLNETMGSSGVSFSTTKSRPSTDMSDLVFLSLDRGMRITRIVTVTTFSDEAIIKMRNAKTREDVLIICRKYKNECILIEHMTLPSSMDMGNSGWAFEQQQGSPVRAKSGVPGSVLWTADISTDECHISVGSWLLGSIPLNTGDGLGALFSRSVSQICGAPQAVVLVRPGFAWPRLVRVKNKIEWSLTFIELQDIDELGVPVRRR